MYNLLTVVLLLACLAVVCCDLKFNANGKFKIVQLTDMHMGELESNDINTRKIQKIVLETEKPDLIVVSGDAISGYAYPNNNTCMKGGVAECWKFNVQAYLDAKIPWAFIFGNHDDQGDLTREQIIKIETSYAPQSLTQRGPTNIAGASNYVLSVKGSKQDKPAANMYFLDSGDDNCLKVKGWGCIEPSQVEWYRSTAQSMKNKHGTLPAIAFVHIPIAEYMNVAHLPFKGNNTEDICCSSVNTGIYAAFKEMGDVNFMTVGHDHSNDNIGDFNGITLAYGRKSGYGGYGPPHGWLRGARVIELTEGTSTVNTWIRQEDGSKVIQRDSTTRSKQYVCGGSVGNEATTNSAEHYFGNSKH